MEKRKIRLLDKYYYYLDLIIKMASEKLQDVTYFFERVLASIFVVVFTVVANFFVSPMTADRPLASKIFFGIPRIIIGLALLLVLAVFALVCVLLGGTFSGLFGFRNIVDYSLKEQVAAWLPLIIFLAILPKFMTEFWIYKVSLVFCFALVLVGFNFLYGQCGILSLGHAGFVLYGSFMTTFLYTGSFGFKLPFFVSMVISGLTSLIFGVVLGLPSLRVKDYYLVIVTLGFMLVIPQILTSQHMARYSGLEMGGLSLDQMPVPKFLSWMSQATWNYYFVVLTVLVLIIFAYNILHHSQVGRAFRTIKCDEEVSTIMGIPVVTYKLLAFAMSGFYASIAGSLITYLTRFISADSFTVNDSIDYVVAAVVSGPGSILGCVFGGIFLTFEKDLASAMADLFLRGNHLTRLFYGVLMIAVVFVVPRGIIGELSRGLKSRWLPKPKRGKYYTLPPPDYDFLDMRGSTIKKE